MRHISSAQWKHTGRVSVRSGVTLVELMIATAVLTIGIVGSMGAFKFTQKSLQLSKNKTLASNLAQEKMQILKQKTYYQIVATTAPVHNSADFAPEVISYDTGYFPPESIIEGGVSYTRYTYIQALREDSGVIGELAANVPDTGMKRITTHVVWGVGDGKRKVTLRSIVANPDTVMSNAVYNGVVLSTWGAPVGGALVSLVEASGYADTVSPVGTYGISATPGTYTLMVAATGYYTELRTSIIPAGETQVQNFELVKVALRKVEGSPWLRDHVVISQIVGSTVDATVTPNFDQEYVELFNPTTFTWVVNGDLGLRFRRSQDFSAKTIQINYLNAEIPSGSYYLFANTTTINAGGGSVEADAVWSPGNPLASFPYFSSQYDIIPVAETGGGEGSGALELFSLTLGAIDRVGWNKTGYPAPFYEEAAINQGIGLSRNELYARRASTSDAAGVDWNYGPAYDSNNNNADFYDYSSGIAAPPRNSVKLDTSISGTPAAGAIISCTDGQSSAVTVSTAGAVGSPQYPYFSLYAATGSWTVMMSSGTATFEQYGVPVTLADGFTFPSTATFLTTSDGRGLLSGRVTNVGGVPLNGITVQSSGASPTTTGADGRYWLRDVGTVNVTANPASAGISSYVTASSAAITLEAGQVHSGVDFVLFQGGRISGFVTRDGINGLPGVALSVLDANGVARDQQVSGTDGRFSTVIISTGYYTVEPALGALETCSPLTSTVTLEAVGGQQFSSTFTVYGALGYISGSVSAGGQPIRSGVLVVVTTATLAGSPPVPPDLSSATLTGAPFYMVSSMENGMYLAEARGISGQTYNVYAYYPTPSGVSAVIISSTVFNVTVIPGQTTTGVNFSW